MKLNFAIYYLGLLSPVSAAVARSFGYDECPLISDVLSLLKKSPQATAYCSQFLQIPVKTQTVYTTSTPVVTITNVNTVTQPTQISVTYTVTNTNTQAALVTQTVTNTDTVTTTPTVTVQCLSTAYYANGGSPSKRSNNLPPKPSGFPSKWLNQDISRACSCLHLSTQTVTTTKTATCHTRTATVQVTSTSVPTATISVPTTNVVTITTTNTNTVTVSATVTVPAETTATDIVPVGIGYQQYTHTWTAQGPGENFDADYFQGQTPTFSGVASSLDFSSPNWPSGSDSITLSDGHQFASTQTALIFQGYFLAPQTDTYTFATNGEAIDNWGYLWLGANAEGELDDDSTAYKSKRTDSDGHLGGTASVSLNEGDAIAIGWLWANGLGPGQSQIDVTAQQGGVILGLVGQLVPQCAEVTPP